MTKLKPTLATASAILFILCLLGCDITPTFKLKVTANPKDGGIVAPTGTIKYNAGTEATVTAMPAAGYRFVGWSGASTATTQSVTIAMNSHQTLTAIFQLIPTFKLEVNANPPNGGTVMPGGAKTYYIDTEVSVTATPAEGYWFVGWSGTLTDTVPSVTVTMNSNQTLTANFRQIPTFRLDVRANPASGGVVTPSGSTTHQIDTEVSVTAMPAAGYWFAGWSGALAAAEPSLTLVMDRDRALTANFQPITSTLADSRDKQRYRTVRIGNRTWMAENLNFKTGGAWCYRNTEANCKKYGRLYNWNTAGGVCPAGWRLPDNDDWNDLTQAAGTDNTAGRKLKSRTGWDNNGNGTDEFDFSALPGGIRLSNDGSSRNLGNGGYWWSATEFHESSHAHSRRINSDGGYVDEPDYHKNEGLSVRCVQN